jgi:hypothetical protein
MQGALRLDTNRSVMCEFRLEVIHATEICAYSRPEEAVFSVANIRMDLHGVLDVIPPDIALVEDRTKNRIVCISYVTEKTRDEAVKDIQERVLKGQIDYGVLVFNRGRGKERFTFTEEGSKAWVNQQIPCDGPCLFVDDSTDHLRSTSHLLPSMTCTLFNTGIQKQLLKILQSFVET